MKSRSKPNVNRSVKLSKLFEDIGAEMRASFDTLVSVSHGLTKGQSEEAIWIDWLRKYLPKRYCVESGFITDCKGKQSLQQDIVIFDRQYSPLLLAKEGVLFIPAESVYAVIEVKTVLNSTEVGDAARKIGSAKSLFRAPAQFVYHSGGISPPQDRGRILGYVVAKATSWASRSTWDRVRRNLSRNIDQIDGGCILSKGAFSAAYTSRGTAVYSTSDQSQSLFGFLGLLFEDIKELGTTPPWDLGTYSDAVKKLRTSREHVEHQESKNIRRSKLK